MKNCVQFSCLSHALPLILKQQTYLAVSSCLTKTLKLNGLIVMVPMFNLPAAFGGRLLTIALSLALMLKVR